VRIYAEEDERGGFDLFADSGHIVDLWLNLVLRDIENLVADEPLPFASLVPARSRRNYLFSLHPVRRGPRGYRVEYTFARGNPRTARHDDDHLYLFPFDHATKHCITQGYNGRFTHSGENQYALDFDLKAGTPVHAARGGVVAEVKTDSSVGGIGPEFDQKGNYILIAHADGSFGNYVHLQRHGSRVRPGDIVDAGDLIGYSGNTGRTSGPHLHFDVRVPTLKGRMRSVPVRFVGVRESLTLLSGAASVAGHEAGKRLKEATGEPMYAAVGRGSTGATDDRINRTDATQPEPGRPTGSDPVDLLSAAGTGIRRSDPRGDLRPAEAEPVPRQIIVPEEGCYYYANHPGLPPFQPHFGSNLRDADFAGDCRPVRRGITRGVELRVERIDSTYVLFLRSGLQSPAAVRVHLGLRGMVSTIRTPLEISIGPECEIFLALLRPEPGARDYGYSSRLRITALG